MCRALTDDEKAAVDLAFWEIKKQHGRTLLAGGWDRAAVFGGLDPTKATTVDEVPGVIALVIGGYRLMEIKSWVLIFWHANGNRAGRLKDGILVGGEYLNSLERKNAK